MVTSFTIPLWSHTFSYRFIYENCFLACFSNACFEHTITNQTGKNVSMSPFFNFFTKCKILQRCMQLHVLCLSDAAD